MTDRALVIGIDAYDGLRPLAAAQRDAGHMAEWLKRPKGGGVLPQHVDLRQWRLQGGGGAQILREVVLDAVVAWIRARMASSPMPLSSPKTLQLFGACTSSVRR